MTGVNVESEYSVYNGTRRMDDSVRAARPPYF
jgi:hypothetical protein